ncbi:MAG TPA: hypothetical protein PKM88_02425 [bacterium]|nr:hypothetical protein [bacterium]
MATELTPRQRVFLNEIFSAAAAAVSDKISRWTGHSFTVQFLDIGYAPLSGIAEAAGGSDLYSVATLLPVQSTVQGYVLFIFPELSAQVFVDLVFNRTIGESQAWGEAEQSVIIETGNILGSTFMNILARAIGKPIATSTPLFLIDYTGSIIQQVVMEHALMGDEAMLARTRFSKDDLDFEEYFFFIPAPGFLAAVDACLDARESGAGR